MPNSTYTLIASNTLTSGATTVSFTDIPQTYTDLVVRFSSRVSDAASGNDWTIRPNGSSTNGSSTMVDYDGSGASAVAASTRNTSLLMGKVPGTSVTANTFGSCEIYIPNYTSTVFKPMSTISVQENNSALNAYIYATAGLYSVGVALTSLTIRPGGSTFSVGSSFFLYGIKNS